MRGWLTGGVAALVVLGSAGDALADPTITFRFATYTPSVVRIEPGQSVTWSGDGSNTFDALTGHPLVFADPAIPGQSDRSTSTKRTFASVGRFSFSCKLHGSTGMSGAVIVSANHPPAAHFGAPSSAAVGAPVAFDASGSSDPDPGQSLTYAWDFDGDGAVDATGPAPAASFAYARAGSYTVTLKVTDSNAEPGVGPESSSTTRSISVGGSSGPGSAVAKAQAEEDEGEGDAPDPDVIRMKVAGTAAHGLTVRLSNAEPARALVTLKFGRLVIGRATATLRAGRMHTIRVVLNRRGRALLARRKRLRAQLRVELDDHDATATTATRTVTLRRGRRPAK